MIIESLAQLNSIAEQQEKELTTLKVLYTVYTCTCTCTCMYTCLYTCTRYTTDSLVVCNVVVLG